MRLLRPSFAVPTVTLALACVALLGGGPPAAAAGPEQVTITGGGYGHGTGMSQYGAYGAARDGRNQRQITSFYYPGTRAGRTQGVIRVQISAAGRGDVVVRPRSNLHVRDLGSGSLLRLPSNGASLWRLTTGADGSVVASYRGPQRWRHWRTLQGGGEFFARGGAIALQTGSGFIRYRGALRRTPEGAVNVLALENYLKGVVPLEMPATWHTQAVRAQAVAARTYAAWERRAPRGSHFDVFDTVSSQVYGGFDAEHPASNRAVEATAREVRMWQGRPAFTQFSSSNGGQVAPGSQPYLRSKPDPYDGWSGNANHTWTARVAAERIERAWPGVGDLRSARVVRRDGHGRWGGRAVTVRLTGSRGTVDVAGPDFRFALGLRSHYFRFG